jgi:hypothetical protein
MRGIQILILLLLAAFPLPGQDTDRIAFNDQELFLNGANIAWISFARDIGPGTTRLDLFEEMFSEMHAHGGNSFRLWLHTNGVSTPAFSGSDGDAEVVGPGVGAIEDLRDILDLAHFYDIGLKLCLWSFDMLQSGLTTAQFERNRALLTDGDKLQAYIDNALIPMVDSLKGHPALLAWEIFNEPEGMTTQFGWTPASWRVNMSDIQWFVNRTVGAIRRTDPDVLITNGSWSFRASSDATPQGVSGSFFNYYRDDRLIAAGGDSLGYLDFYSVHYYKHFQAVQSPFSVEASFWQLDKPIVIGEFYLNDPRQDGDENTIFGVHWSDLYEALYENGYAGAMGWQWFDWWAERTDIDGVNGLLQWPNMLINMQYMFDTYREDVELLLAGLRVQFSAFPPGIEEGGTSTLSWRVRGAQTVTLNGEPVDHEGTLEVSPDSTATYILIADDGEGETEEHEITIIVLDPTQVNRALLKPVYASSEQDEVAGESLPAQNVNDGSLNTRWSSKWRDNEWIFIDLDASYAIHMAVLRWEDAYGVSYDIDVSYDGVNWTTVYEERNGTGGVDSIAVDPAIDARFVRMYGRGRTTIGGDQFGFSLYEFEVYGIPSIEQPPRIAIVSPIENAFLEVNVPFTIAVEAEAGTRDTLLTVDIYADAEHLGTFTEPPYETQWQADVEGEYSLYAIVTDGVFEIYSLPRIAIVSPEAESIRFEAETASLTGSAQAMNDATASGGSFVRMNEAEGSTITWSNIEIIDEETYGLRFGFRLPYDDPKGQHIYINGELAFEELMFTGSLHQWLTLDLNVELASGTNTIMIDGVWGWMDFDYIEIRGHNLKPPVTVSDADGTVYTFDLAQNYPNPFNPSTTISYSLAEPADVKLVVYDITGRRVAVLVDERQHAGTYRASFDARGLASGVYLYRIRAGSFVETRKLMLIK